MRSSRQRLPRPVTPEQSGDPGSEQSPEQQMTRRDSAADQADDLEGNDAVDGPARQGSLRGPASCGSGRRGRRRDAFTEPDEAVQQRRQDTVLE